MKKESILLGKLFKKIAPRIGARVILEPRWGIVGQIIFKNGRHSFFRYNTVDLNRTGASDIARDKDYSNFFMAKMGYPVIPGTRTFFSNHWAQAIGAVGNQIEDAYKYARQIGFPVIVKPNSGSQGSRVSLVYNKKEFYRAIREVFKKDNVSLVQPWIPGNDYRLVVLDDNVISAYMRSPLKVTGDGISTIADLLEKKQSQFNLEKRDTQIKKDDPRIKIKLQHQGLDMQSIPDRKKSIYLLDNANLSGGGDSIDVTLKVHPLFKQLAIRLTRDMGLRLCGVDMIIDGDIGEKPDKYYILEINASPGLDHYAKTGKQQEKIVEDLYLQVLKGMEH